MRDPLVAEPLLPRFLAPGDEARLAVLLHNLDLPPASVATPSHAGRPARAGGPDTAARQLAQGAQARAGHDRCTATGAGRGVIRLDVTGAGGFSVQRETRDHRPPRPAASPW